jgi:hypothetical protein
MFWLSRLHWDKFAPNSALENRAAEACSRDVAAQQEQE